MTKQDSRPVAIYLSLHEREVQPALDLQLDGLLRRMDDTDVTVALGGRPEVVVTGDVVGRLNRARRGQLQRLVERVSAESLPASIAFSTDSMADKEFVMHLVGPLRWVIGIGNQTARLQVWSPWWPKDDLPGAGRRYRRTAQDAQ